MSQMMLFAKKGKKKAMAPKLPVGRAGARVRHPVREQLEWRPQSLESLIPADHLVRTIWALLEKLDLGDFYDGIRVAWDRPGRPASDPRVLLGLWVMACIDNVGSARRLAKLSEEHNAYRWLRGGVPVDYHLLADFRVKRQAALDELLSHILAALEAADAISLETVAQDGVRVRASAGAPSFRRGETLAQCLEEAKAQVERLAKERQKGEGGDLRHQRAQERAAQQRLRRVEEAMQRLPQLEEAKALQKKRFSKEKRERVGEARASTTDPDASVMKMAGGGFRPAYNFQFATDHHAGVIVGVSVTNAGTDAHQAPGMVEQILKRLKRQPRQYLMDGGYGVRDDITALGKKGVTVYTPIRLPKHKAEEERYQPHPGDSDEVRAWRQRMSQPEAQTLYRQRSIAEWSNAQLNQHGLSRLTVRGMNNALSVALLLAVTHNLLRWASL